MTTKHIPPAPATIRKTLEELTRNNGPVLPKGISFSYAVYRAPTDAPDTLKRLRDNLRCIAFSVPILGRDDKEFPYWYVLRQPLGNRHGTNLRVIKVQPANPQEGVCIGFRDLVCVTDLHHETIKRDGGTRIRFEGGELPLAVKRKLEELSQFAAA